MSRALVVLCHGGVEQPERLNYAVGRLNGSGYRVVALAGDGHGHPETRSRHSFNTALADLGTLITEATAAQALPVIVLGHSTGAAIALRYAIDHPGELTGLILTAPLAQLPPGTLARMFGTMVSTLLPDAPPEREPGISYRDPTVQADYITDPLTRLGQIPMSSGAEAARRAAEIMDGLDTITLPVLLLWGTREGLTPSGGAEHLLGALEHAPLTRRSFDSLYHELLGGPQHEQVLDAIEAWLDQVL